MTPGANANRPSLLIDQVAQAWPPRVWRDVHLVAAVSGGADSVAMLRVIDELKRRAGGEGKLHVAHFNHHLRGGESDADAEWVARLCEELGVPCFIGEASNNRLHAGGEQAARNARYDFLLATAERLGARFVATAHTASDQIETLLMRLFRGTSVAGLTGVPAERPLSPAVTVVRPLLGITRADVLAELARLGQSFREDATNADPRYTRNRVRHTLLPQLREQFGTGVEAALLRIAEQASEAQQVIDIEACRLAADAIEHDPARKRVTVRRIAIRHAAPLLVAEAVKIAWREAGWPEQAMGRQQWRQLGQLIGTDDPPDAFDLPGNVDARRDTDYVRLTRR